MQPNLGKVIAIEGVMDFEKLLDYLIENLKDTDVVFAQDLADTPLSEKIRGLEAETGDLGPQAEISLFCTGRTQTFESLVKPAQNAGKHVIYMQLETLTAGYQLFAKEKTKNEQNRRGLPELDIIFNRQNEMAKMSIEPNLLILLDNGKVEENSEENKFTNLLREKLLTESSCCEYEQRNNKNWQKIATEKLTEEQINQKVLEVIKKELFDIKKEVPA